MNLAGIAAGYGGIVEGEQDYADRQARNVRTQQGNMDNAIRLRQMREMDAARKAQLEIGRQAPEEYTRITPGTTGYADAEKVAPAAPAPSAAAAPASDAYDTRLRREPVRGTPSTNNVPKGIDTGNPGEARRLAQYAPGGPRAPQKVVVQQPFGIRGERTPGMTYLEASQLDAARTPNPQDEAARFAALRAQNPGTGTQTYTQGPAPAAAPAPVNAAPSAAGNQYDRPTQYDALLGQAAQQAGVDPAMFKRLIGSESSFNPAAVSPRGESYGYGIAQIAASHGLTREQMANPAVALPFAARLLAQYIKDAGGNVREGVLRYKGAQSEQGRAAMGQVYDQKIAGSVQAKLGAQTPTVGPGVNEALPNALPATPAIAPEATYKATEVVDLTPRAAGLAQKRMEMLGRERQTYVSLMQASYDPAEQMKLRQAILGIDAGMATADLTQLAAGAANGSREALVTLAQTTANQIGTQISVQDAGEGRVILTVSGRQQPAVTMAQAARQFHLALNEELRKTVAAAEAKNAAEQAKQFYQGQRELAVEDAKGDNARRLARLQGRERRETALVEGTLTMAQKEADRAAGYEYGKGQYTLRETADGRLLMYPKSGTGVKLWVPGETGGQFSTDGEWVDTEQG